MKVERISRLACLLTLFKTQMGGESLQSQHLGGRNKQISVSSELEVSLVDIESSIPTKATWQRHFLKTYQSIIQIPRIICHVKKQESKYMERNLWLLIVLKEAQSEFSRQCFKPIILNMLGFL